MVLKIHDFGKPHFPQIAGNGSRFIVVPLRTYVLTTSLVQDSYDRIAREKESVRPAAVTYIVLEGPDMEIPPKGEGKPNPTWTYISTLDFSNGPHPEFKPSYHPLCKEGVEKMSPPHK